MDLEDFYRRQEAAAQNDATAKEIRQYNTWVRHIRDLTAQMAERARTSPPDTCERVEENGKWEISWQLDREYDDTYRINLMPDGRIVYVKGSYYDSAQAGKVVRTLDIREVSSPEEYEARGINWMMLSHLFDSVVSTQGNRFGIHVPSELHGAMTRHWGDSWSQYK